MPSLDAAVDRSIQDTLDGAVGRGLPGAFVYRTSPDGERFWTAGFADPATRTPMTADSIYRIGSTTKTFTSVVVQQLLDEDRLSLDDLVQEWLPNLPIPSPTKLRVKHLLRMRSGIADFEDDPSLLDDLDAHRRPMSLARALELGLAGQPAFEPGRRFAYSNTNYCLLEAIVERVTGKGLGPNLQRRVFEPLGLTRTSYPDEDDLSLPEPYVRGFDWVGDGWVGCSEVFYGRGDGGILSTARDLGRFFRALLIERTLVSEAALARMTDATGHRRGDLAYGMGLVRDDMPCGPVWGHAGGGFGYASAPFVRVETGVFAIVMRNGSFGLRASDDPEVGRRLAFGPALRPSLYC